MGEIWKIFFIWLLHYALITDETFAYNATSMTEIAFVTNDIVPDIIPYAPTCQLSVKYSGKIEISLGQELFPTEVKNHPNVTWKPSCDFYTLLMIDPDAPSRDKPTYRNLKHWHVGNIPGNQVASGETIAEYIGAAPSLGSGFHRYVLLVYKQPGKLVFNEPRLDNRSINNRTGFSVIEFAAKYKLGDPIAGNLFLAQYDDYVPILEKQLGL